MAESGGGGGVGDAGLPAALWRRCGRSGLILSVSASWVSVAQLARLAEQRTNARQHASIVPIMVCANAAAWMVLAVPHVLRKLRETGNPATGKRSARRPFDCLWTDAFEVSQPPRFLAIALSTNFCYIAALHFLPASLNTAVFSTSPIFTLLLSCAWLPADLGADAPTLTRSLSHLGAAMLSRRAISVALSVLGVLMIAEPWDAGEGRSHFRTLGVLLSLFAAWGTSAYQVYFKLTFGARLRPDEVGLFLAHMGFWSSSVLGTLLLGLLATGAYHLNFELVPWHLVGATAAASALFNFVIKFGLSVDSPLAMSLATQIGIPMNLLLDVVVVRAEIDAVQSLGALLMLASFRLQQQRDPPPARESEGLSERLVGN